MDNETLAEISKKLSVLIALQLKGEKGAENIAQLERFGLSNTQIAEILGTTAGTVSVARARLKKTHGKKRKK